MLGYLLACVVGSLLAYLVACLGTCLLGYLVACLLGWLTGWLALGHGDVAEADLRVPDLRAAAVHPLGELLPPLRNSRKEAQKQEPLGRSRVTARSVAFAGVVTSLLSRQNPNVERWLHTVREEWRQKQFEQLARNRPNFLGVQQNLLLQYLKQLEVNGRSARGQPVSEDQESARMRACVMRLLLTGGLFTQDVVTRHKFNQQTECFCAVGGQCTVEHISWACSHYSHLRQRLVDLAPRINRAKKCFKCAGILTQADAALATHIVLIHPVLVDIWQAAMRKYLYADEPSLQTILPLRHRNRRGGGQTGLLTPTLPQMEVTVCLNVDVQFLLQLVEASFAVNVESLSGKASIAGLKLATGFAPKLNCQTFACFCNTHPTDGMTRCRKWQKTAQPLSKTLQR